MFQPEGKIRRKNAISNTRLLKQANSGRHLQHLGNNDHPSNRYFKSAQSQQSHIPQEDIGDIRRLMRYRNEDSLDMANQKYPSQSLH